MPASSTVQPDTTITIDSLVDFFPIKLRITDDDSNQIEIQWHLKTKLGWNELQIPDKITSIGNISLLKDVAYLFNYTGSKIEVWKSEDIKNWSKVADDVPWKNLGTLHKIIVCKGKLWFLPIPLKKDSLNTIWSSEDGVVWQQNSIPIEISKSISPQDYFLTYLFCGTYNDELVIGYTGEYPNQKGTGVVWTSQNGIVWSQIKASNQGGVELPLIQYSTTYKSMERAGKLLVSNYVKDQGNEIWEIDHWNSITKIFDAKFGWNGFVLFEFDGQLSFISNESVNNKMHNIMYYFNNGSVVKCADLTSESNELISESFVYKGKYYLYSMYRIIVLL